MSLDPDRRRRARELGEEKGRMMREYLYTSTTGMEVGVGIAMGALVGWWADGKLGTAPWGLFVGLFLGMAHATRRLWGLVRRELAKSDDDGANDDGAGGAPPPAGPEAGPRDDDDVGVG